MLGRKKPPTPERPRRLAQPVQPRNAVFSYHASRVPRTGATTGRDREATASTQERTKRLRAPNLQRAPQLFILFAAGVLVLLNLRLSGHAKVVTVETSKGQIFLRSQQLYESAAESAFRPLLNGNKLTINTDGIAARLKVQFPELHSVSVSLPFIGTQPVVYIQPATPKLILVTQSNGLYVLDEDGRALIKGSQVPSLDKLQLPVVTDQSELDITVGQVALPRSTAAFISEVAYQLHAKGITIRSLVLPAGTSELQVRMDGVGYFVKYNLYGNAREETGSYLALKKRLDATHKVPKEYVDVRVEQRVYYK